MRHFKCPDTQWRPAISSKNSCPRLYSDIPALLRNLPGIIGYCFTTKWIYVNDSSVNSKCRASEAERSDALQFSLLDDIVPHMVNILHIIWPDSDLNPIKILTLLSNIKATTHKKDHFKGCSILHTSWSKWTTDARNSSVPVSNDWWSQWNKCIFISNIVTHMDL